MNNDTKLKRIFSKENRGTLLIFIVSIFVIFGIIIYNNINSNFDPTAGGELTTKDTPAFIEYNEMPFLPGSSTYSNLQLREDLAYYARNYIDHYKKNPSDSIMFRVTDAEGQEIKDKKLAFSGRFAEDNLILDIRIEERNNFRIKTTIINTKSNKSHSEELPSSNIRNDFIANLPYVSGSFMIEYVAKKDSFFITIYEDDENALGDAYEYIEKSLKITSFKSEKLDLLYTPSISNQEGR